MTTLHEIHLSIIYEDSEFEPDEITNRVSVEIIRLLDDCSTGLAIVGYTTSVDLDRPRPTRAYMNLLREWTALFLDQRRGQAAFNLLHVLRPDLADLVRGSEHDPFYTDERLPAFLEWLGERWHD